MDSARTHPPRQPSHSQYPQSALSLPAAVPPPAHYQHQQLQYYASQPAHHQSAAPVVAPATHPAYHHPPPPAAAPPPPPEYRTPYQIASSYPTQGPLPPIYTERDGHPPQQAAYPQPQQSPSSNLPPVRPPSSARQSPHEPGNDHIQRRRTSQTRPGHVTPASASQRPQEQSQMIRHSPSTPAHAGPYHQPPQHHPLPPGSDRSGPQHMDHGQPQPYTSAQPLTNGLHGPSHPMHHDQGPPSYAPTPTLEHQPAPYAMHGHFAAPPQQSGYSPYGPASYGPNSAAATANKRKPMRAQQACEQCRQRKQKCDEGTPCSFCKEQNITCNYRDPGPAKTDKNAERMLSTMETLQDRLLQQGENIEKIMAMQADMQSKMDHRLSALERITGADEKMAIQSTTPEPKPTPPAPAQAPVSGQSPAAQSLSPSDKQEHWSEHRTGAHNLIMLWPSVRPLFKSMTGYSSSYVKEAEERGIIRINGKGQGIDDQGTPPLPGPASPAQSEDSSESGHTPREGLWGRGFAGNATTPDMTRSYGTDGGFNPDGTLDISTATINLLFESFKTHIHPMHPFLERQKTRRMVDIFITNYSPGAKVKAGFVNGTSNSGELDRPSKRVRIENFSSSGRATTSSSEGHTRSTPQIEHSPANAIVLLILALGKICLWTEPLPGVLGEGASSAQVGSITGNTIQPTSSPMTMPYKPSPFSPRTTPNAHPTPSDHSGPRTGPRSPRQSFDIVHSSTAKNSEYIPGMAYFAKAAEILGGHTDGSELMHAHMFLLAALYKGQLARVKESAQWLNLAGRTCYGLIDKYQLYRKKNNKELDPRLKYKQVRSILMAAWTCLQLEADILAEMSYPPSPIQQIEGVMLLPHMVPDDEDYGAATDSADLSAEIIQDHNTHVFYSAQLYLRRRLNNAHRVLFGHALQGHSVEHVRASLLAQQQEIVEWRKALSDLMKWNDSDPPASTILNARLRAKWYGASYVIHRPFLDYVLHIMPQVRDGGCTITEAARNAEGEYRDQTDIKLFESIHSMDEGDIWDAARQCVDSALRSTVALDGMHGRLIVTNIHGTAHAQFGNMLVLAAAYNTEYLKEVLIRKDQLQPKLDRTIKFLRKLAPISPTSALDCSILERIQQKLFVSSEVMQTFENEKEPASASASFSS